MMTIISSLVDRLVRAIDRITTISAAGFLTMMLGLVVFQALARYGFSNAPAWTEEAARYAMIWTGLLGGVSAFLANQDPVIVKVDEHAPRWRRRVQSWATVICVTAFLALLLVFSVGFIGRASLRHTEALGWNFAAVAVIIPIYCGLLIVASILRLLQFELHDARRDEIAGEQR